jgi:hypothetical protein
MKPHKRRVKTFAEFIDSANEVKKSVNIPVKTDDDTGNTVDPNKSKSEIVIQEKDDAAKAAMVDILKDQLPEENPGDIEMFVGEFMTLNPEMTPEDITVEDYKSWKNSK